MHAATQIEALKTGKIDVGFTRPLEPPHDRLLRSELLYRDPIIAVMPKDHPLAGGPAGSIKVNIKALAHERFVTCDRQATPSMFNSILALCTSAGFSPEIVNSSETWAGVLTLVEAGEGIALVPSGVRYLRTPGLVFAEILPETTHVGLSVAWNPRNEDPVLTNFLRLVRANKDRIRKSV